MEDQFSVKFAFYSLKISLLTLCCWTDRELLSCMVGERSARKIEELYSIIEGIKFD